MDLSQLFSNGRLLSECMGLISRTHRINSSDVLLAIELRGVPLATLLSLQTGAKMYIVRKKGKSPGNFISIKYEKEYGSDEIELDRSSITTGNNFFVVDDVIATGGTIRAARLLGERLGGIFKGAVTLFDIGLEHGLEVKHNLTMLNVVDGRMMLPGNGVLSKDLFKFGPVPNDSRHQRKIVLYHPSLESLVIELAPGYAPSKVSWERFTDGTPNFKIPNDLEDCDVKFLLSGRYPDLLDQLQIIRVLPQQGVKSLEIICPFFPYATMERLDMKGDIATAETVAKQISVGMPQTKTGPVIFTLFDIHATPGIFYFSTEIKINNVQLMQRFADSVNKTTTIVFPDDGAYKRFYMLFPYNPLIICAKKREGNNRKIFISDYKHCTSLLEALTNPELVIVDDLTRTGGTLLETAKVLMENGSSPKQIQFFVVHADFQGDSYLKFHGYGKFTVFNTVPNVTKYLPRDVFNVLSCGTSQNYQDGSEVLIFVASCNDSKIRAAITLVDDNLRSRYLNNIAFRREIYSIDVESGVPAQPFDDEGKMGCRNRLHNLQSIVDKIPEFQERRKLGIHVFFVAIENYITKIDGTYYDIPAIAIDFDGKDIHEGIGEKVTIPNYAVEASLASEQTMTAGSVIEAKYGLKKDEWYNFYHDKSRYELITAYKI